MFSSDLIIKSYFCILGTKEPISRDGIYTVTEVV